MRVKTIHDEDFVNYKKPSMFIGTISCGGKCCIEANLPMSVCQNDGWRTCAPIIIDDEKICRRYIHNNITKAIVFGGLEPIEQIDEILDFLHHLRNWFRCLDDVVIYTGYYPAEITECVKALKIFPNIIIKYGRFIPNRPHRYDDTLGVELSSDNQFAERVS
jgi:hypothetical protein